MNRALIVAVLGAVAMSDLSAQEWPQFRGPRAGVIADDPNLPERWSETENVVWKTGIPGQSWSSPIVSGDQIFVTTAISEGQERAPARGLADPTPENGRMTSAALHRWVVYGIDFRTGKIRWERELHKGAPPIARHSRNSYASETPITDGERIYVYFGSIGLLAALTVDGTPVWTRNIGAFETVQGWGTAASPVLHRDRLFIVNDNRVQSFVAAFDARTGQELWKVPRPEPESWSSPFVWETATRTEIVVPGDVVRSYDRDGRLLWQLGGMSIFGPIPTPFANNGLLYVSSGYPGSVRRPTFAVRPGASGDISVAPNETSSEYVAWVQPLLGSYQTSALAYGDYYYTLQDRGFLLCHDARTGKQIYGRQRLSGDVSGFAASPWAYNGKIFALSEDGDTFVVQAGPEYKLLGKNSLNEMAMATPAVARGSLIIRTQSQLYRLAKDVQK